MSFRIKVRSIFGAHRYAIPPQRPYTNLIAKSITILFAVAILAGTLLPVGQLPEVDSGDKAAHLIAFALLAFPLNMAARPRWFLLNTGFVLFGGAIELIQPLVGRHGEWLDLGADMLGVVVGMTVARGLYILIARTN